MPKLITPKKMKSKGYMKKFIITLSPIIILFFSNIGSTKDYTTIYSMQDLTKAKTTYEKSLLGIWKEDLIEKLENPNLEAAKEVSLNIPIFGNRGGPFEFYANAQKREVTIPIFAVKFLDDIFTAIAYVAFHDCRIDPISDYAGMLRYQAQDNLPSKKFPPPLIALGIPSNAISDHRVYKSSGNALKSTVYFIMAHELAHVIFAHRSYGQITAVEAQNQEIQADEFALNVMGKIGVPPVALGHFFAIISRFESAPGDFATMSGFEAYLREQSTHPLSSERLKKVSQSIRINADNFIRIEKENISRPQIYKIADDIQKISDILDDRAIREYQRYRSINTLWGEISSTCK
jgi:hypothetical protein